MLASSPSRARRFGVLAAALVALLVLLAAAAYGAELNTAELQGTVNNVTVEQGQTVPFTVSLWATGTIRCTATPANPATAKVDTAYNVDAAGSVTSTTLSGAVPFYGDAFCNVTWPGDPTPQTVTAAVKANINTPIGDYAIRLHTVMTTPAGTGSTLVDSTPTLVTFHVIPSSDHTPPTVTCGAPTGTLGTNGWYTSEVSVACTSSDSGSGLKNASDASFTLATTGDGSASTASKTVSDVAGNTTTVGPFGAYNIDTVAPSVSCGAPTGINGTNGWYNGDVSVACTSSDATAGLNDPSDASFVLGTTGDGGVSTGARTVTDAAGNATSVGPFGPYNVDSAVPVVACGSPAGTLGSDGWYTSAVTVSCTASDATSGLANSADAAIAFTTSGEGEQSLGPRVVTDVAGLSSSTGTFGPFDVDLTDPSVSIASPADGAVYILGTSQSASYSCDDTALGSGIDTCAGGSIDTSSVGTKTLSVTATDRSGRTTTVTHTYSVDYSYSAQLQTGSGRTTLKAGSAAPAWFSLGGVSDPSAVSGIYSTQVPCGSTAQAPLGAPIAMAGNGLSYDPTTDRFSFIWKTDKAWVGTCRQLQVALNDGTVHASVFEIR